MTDKTAMRDSNGNTVFVNQYGEYVEEFPEKYIVDNGNGDYTVYFFVPSDDHKYGYVELSYKTEDKEKALKFAKEIYGKEINLTRNVSGEVFEIEVHQNEKTEFDV